MIDRGQVLAMKISISWDEEELDMMFARDLKFWLFDEVARELDKRRSTDCLEKKGDPKP